MAFNDYTLTHLFLRIVTDFVQSLIQLSKSDWIALDYSTICRRQSILILQLAIKIVVVDSIYSV